MSDTPNKEVIDALTDKQTPPAPDPEVTLIVAGKEVKKPQSEWLKDAQKAAGADAKLREAEEALRVRDAVDLLHNPAADPLKQAEAQAFLLRRAGLNDEQIKAMNNTPTPDDSTPPSSGRDELLQQEVEKLKKGVEYVTGLVGDDFDQQLENAVDAAITRNAGLAVYLSDTDGPVPKGRRDMLASVLRQKALDLMHARRNAGEAFKPSMIGEAVKAAEPEAAKYAEQVIGAPSTLSGRAAATMFGAETVQRLKEKPQLPQRGASLADFQKWANTELLQAALTGPNTSSRA